MEIDNNFYYCEPCNSYHHKQNPTCKALIHKAKGAWYLDFDKKTYQGKVMRKIENYSPDLVYSRVFYVPDVNDVHFDNIQALPCAVSEKYRQEIIKKYK